MRAASSPMMLIEISSRKLSAACSCTGYLLFKLTSCDIVRTDDGLLTQDSAAVACCEFLNLKKKTFNRSQQDLNDIRMRHYHNEAG